MYLLLLAYPIAEIALFILIGKLAQSWEWVVLPTIATSLLGYALLRGQRRWQIFGKNDFTPRSIENYLFGNLGAFALLMPGFISDLLGLILVIPWTRRLLLSMLKALHFDIKAKAHGPFSVFRTYSFSSTRQYYPEENGQNYDYSDTIDVDAHNPSSDDPSQSDDNAIDVEYIVRN